MKKNKKIGLFFGSFNPIHIGHLAIANYIVEFSDLAEIWFVVTPHNPFKEKKSLLADHHRLHLVNLSFQNYPNFKASDIEFHLPQPNYTINTLTHLQEKYPQKQFALIMGSDNLLNFHKWKNYQTILQKFDIYVYPRNNATINTTQYPQVKPILAPKIEISSTFIRQAIKDKKDIRFFLPPNVFEEIDKMNFYK